MTASSIEMGFGALVVIAGLLLFYLGKESGHNRFVIFGQIIELSTPALVIIVLGCVIFVLPVLLPIWLGPDKLNHKSDEASREEHLPVPAREKTQPGSSSIPGTPVGSPADRFYATTLPGVTARITQFIFRDASAVIEVMFENDNDHDADFCSRPDSWRITDEINPASCGWPLLGSGGSAVCDSPQWKQMKPGGTATAFAVIRCPTGEDDSWSLYLPELRQIPRGLRFGKAP